MLTAEVTSTMPSTRTLVLALLIGLAFGYGLAFTRFGEVGELVAAVALVALIFRGVGAAARHARHGH
jgi:hypothetical protein